MDTATLIRLVRNFQENGLKVLLENPANVQDVLNILGVRCVGRIDFSQMRLEPAHFVQPDYRHLASDLVLRAPLTPSAEGPSRTLTIYILIEHQAEPDRLMAFRVLEYLVQIYKRQLRQWEQEQETLDGFEFQPVLPIVLYTGTRTWDRLLKVSELLADDEDLRGWAPEFAPLFLNVSQIGGETLETNGGAFGRVLRLIQQRWIRRAAFEDALRQVVRALESQLATTDRDRWLSLLSYIQALIYNDRDGSEREELRELVAVSVKNDSRRSEVYNMGQTIAELLREEGRAEGAIRSLRQVLLLQLETRFGEVPEGIRNRIEHTDSVDQLNIWLKAFVRARKLSGVGIPPLD